MLEQDRQNLQAPVNLKYIHIELLRLQKSNTSSEISNLQDYYKPLNEFSEDFDSYLWELTSSVIYFNNGQAKATIVQLVEIIEEKESFNQNSNDSGSSSIEVEGISVFKSYKEKFLEALKDSVTVKFENILSKSKGNHSGIIEKLEFVYDDLKLINDQIAPQFPSHYNINNELASTYHKNVYVWLDDILKSDPSVTIILGLVRWVRKYHIIILVDLQISKDLLKPQLLDGREQELVESCLDIIRNKIHEWESNLIKSNVEEFTQRTQKPYVDENQIIGLPSTSTAIEMVNQQVEFAIKSAHEKILVEVVKECCQVMIDLQQAMNKTLESELLSYLEDREKSPDGFMEYALALGNDQLRYAEFIEVVVGRATQASKEYINEINERTNPVLGGCFQLANDAIHASLKIIFEDVKKPFLVLHTSAWYKEEPQKYMKIIITTLKDYADDYRSHLKPYLFDKFMQTMTQFFVIAYIESMINEGAKYKAQCLDRMRQDIQEARNYFGQYLKAADLEKQFDPIIKLQEFLNTKGEMIYVDYNAIKSSYGDVPRKLFKRILYKREGLSVIEKNKLNNILKAKESEAGEYTGEPTIFSKVRVEHDVDVNAYQLKDGFRDKLRSVKKLI